MELLNNKIQQIIKHIDGPDTNQHTGDKDICYLTYPFELVLEVKKHVNTLRFCELVVKVGDCKKINLTTGFDDNDQRKEAEQIFEQISANLFDHGIEFRFQFSNTLHDREIKLNNNWGIKMGRGLDYFQSLSGNYFQVGANDLDLRNCLETSFDYYKLK